MDGLLRIRWLGCAGFALETGGTTLLLDPFASRPHLARVALPLPLRPDRAAIDRFLPRADAVVCGHAHYDHLLDAPAVALRDGAVFAGSRTAALVARASGVPADRIREIPAGGGGLVVGPFALTFVPSRHGGWAFGRAPFCGCLTQRPRLPMPARRYLDGGVFGVHVKVGDVAVYHQGSAGLDDDALHRSGLRADVVLACLAGRRFTPAFLSRLARPLGARTIGAMHWDDFFRPLGGPVRPLPGVDLAGFPREARDAGAEPWVPWPGDELVLSTTRAHPGVPEGELLGRRDAGEPWA